MTQSGYSTPGTCRTFNRTNVELKSRAVRVHKRHTQPINRTNVELKFDGCRLLRMGATPFNQTNVELKSFYGVCGVSHSDSF